ncbi:MAG TPA: hypothetical protein VIX12_04605 [Candidatus Binataceae bacterium]
MSYYAIGVYREPEFSPGKVEADAAILDEALAQLAGEGFVTQTFAPGEFAERGVGRADVVLAMCQGEPALRRLAEVERSGARAINSALSIRNCYRDLLAAGLARAGVPAPAGALIRSDAPLDIRALPGVDLSLPVFVKRGDLHALNAGDVQRAHGRMHLQAVLAQFAARGIRTVYVQQECAGTVVKFYGVDGGYFSARAESGEMCETALRDLSSAAARAARALGLQAWGGDAVISEAGFEIIDFNDWPSYSRVRGEAARAIARRAVALMSRGG